MIIDRYSDISGIVNDRSPHVGRSVPAIGSMGCRNRVEAGREYGFDPVVNDGCV
jgi:hypothetical protein